MMHLLVQCGCKDSSESPRHVEGRTQHMPPSSSTTSVHGSQQRPTALAAAKLGYERFNINSSHSAESPVASSSHAINRNAAAVSASSLSIPSSNGSSVSNLVAVQPPSVKASLGPFKTRRTAPLWLEGEETTMGLPDGEVPNFQTFCPYERWSAAFASPGDFTIKAAHVKRSSGTVVYNLALVGLSVPPPSAPSSSGVGSPHHSLSRARPEATHFSTNSLSMYASSDHRYAQFPRPRKDKVQSVSVVTKSEEEITAFVHSTALRFPGHKIVSLFTRKMNKAGRNLDDRIAAVVDVLSFVLSITHIGVHGLIPVKEPVPQDLRVRLFLNLHCWSSHMGAVPTGSNSCDGRLESHSENVPTPTRKSIPSEWFELAAFQSKVASTSKLSKVGVQPSSSMRPSMSSSNLPRMRRRSLPQAVGPMPYCTTYVPPNAWRKKAKEFVGAFTVVVSGIHVQDDGVVEYMLTVLFVDSASPSSPRTRTVGHRYQDFDDLAVHIRNKTKLTVSMPPKTLFRSVDPAFLETRAVDLQRFIDSLLPLHFTGMLDQRIDMAAEPRVRAFFELPTVQWSVVAELPTKKDLDRFRALSNSSTASSRSVSLPKDSDDEDGDDDDDDGDDDGGSGGDERVFADFENRVDRPFLSNRRSISSQYYPVSRGVA